MTIDLDQHNNSQGYVDVLKIRISGNVAEVNVAFKLNNNDAPWMTFKTDAVKDINVPAANR